MVEAFRGRPMAEIRILLVMIYLSGSEGLPNDPVEGLKWLRRAAEHDDPLAQDTLAIRLIKGVDVSPDSAEALKWLRRAAERGNAMAQNDLGYALETGEADKPDLVEVCTWYRLASEQGIAQAKVNLSRLIRRLSAEQQLEVARRVRDFRLKPEPQLTPVRSDEDAGASVMKSP